MGTMIIFTDAAISPPHNLAIGAYLSINQVDMDDYASLDMHDLYAKLHLQVMYVQYQSNKSTWTEINTVIIALNNVLKTAPSPSQIEIYTDCQSLCDLLGARKEKLKRNNFMTRSGKPHPHAELYQDLFSLTDALQLKVFKIKGHAPNKQRTTIYAKIFSIVDKLSRKKLRDILEDQNQI